MARILHCPNCDAIIDESVFGTGNTVVCEYCKSVILLDPNERKVLTVDDRARIAREEYERRQQEYKEKKKQWDRLNLRFIIINFSIYFVMTIISAFSSVIEVTCCCSYTFLPTVFAVYLSYKKPEPPTGNVNKDNKVATGFLLYFIHSAVTFITAMLIMLIMSMVYPKAYDYDTSSHIENNATTTVTTTEETTDNYSTYLKDGFYYIV